MIRFHPCSVICPPQHKQGRRTCFFFGAHVIDGKRYCTRHAKMQRERKALTDYTDDGLRNLEFVRITTIGVVRT